MKTRWVSMVAVVVMLLGVTGCKSLFPASDARTKSRWQNLDQVQHAYDNIITNQTGAKELKRLGFDPYENPNIKILNYLDIMQRFLINPSIKKEDLPPGVQDAIAAQEACYGYELELSVTNSKRYGNLFLDMTGFKRKTHTTGWNFKALIVLHDDRVVYKLWSGEPQVDRYESTRKPLGPFQEVDGMLRAIPGTF